MTNVEVRQLTETTRAKDERSLTGQQLAMRLENLDTAPHRLTGAPGTFKSYLENPPSCLS